MKTKLAIVLLSIGCLLSTTIMVLTSYRLEKSHKALIATLDLSIAQGQLINTMERTEKLLKIKIKLLEATCGSRNFLPIQPPSKQFEETL